MPRFAAAVRFARCFALCATLSLAACSSPQGRSGFLGDDATYDRLKPTDYDSDVLAWRAEGADLTKFDAFVVDPITVHLNEEGRDADLEAKDTQALADKWRGMIEGKLAERYEVVERPGPRVAHIRAALTNMDSNTVALNVLPQTVLLGFGIGGASMELEVLDGGTGKRLVAAMADEKGTRYKYLNGLSEWGHAEEVLEYWAEMIRMRVDAAYAKE